MKLRLKKTLAYIVWPFLYIGVEAWIYIYALGIAWEEYREATKRTGHEQMTFIKGFKYIHNYKEPNGN